MENPHTYLITGGNKQERTAQAKEFLLGKDTSPDNIIIEKGEKRTIGIDQIRELIKRISLKPHQEKRKTALILEAQHLTQEAQNALLKTLEEPPAHSTLVLTAPHPTNLLTTVVSRCVRKRLPPQLEIDPKSKEFQEAEKTFKNLVGESRGERLAWLDKNKKELKSRETARHMLNCWLYILKKELRNKEISTEKKLQIKNWTQKGLNLSKLLKETSLSAKLAMQYFLTLIPPKEEIVD
ncbi:MAG: hypothetical protein ACOC6Q_01520 [Patescibacteria group bacterium]